jgi:L-asparaginase II
MTGQQVAATGIDGCGAPLFATSLEGLARSFAALATAGTHTPAGRVADVIRRHPLMLGGTGRDVTRLIEAVPGLVAKDGAEGVYALALADGAAAALKVSDGAERARPPVVIALLRRLGAPVHGLDDLATPLVLGGGRPTGAIRVTWRITAG